MPDLSDGQVTQQARACLLLPDTCLRELIPGLSLQSESRIDTESLLVRTRNCLNNQAIHQWGDLLDMTISDLMRIRSFGERSVIDLLEAAVRRSGVTNGTLRERGCPSQAEISALPEPSSRNVRKALRRLLANRHACLRELLPQLDGVAQCSIQLSQLSVRTRNCLHKRKIQTWEDLLPRTVGDLYAIQGMGEASVGDLLSLAVRVAISANGLEDSAVNTARRDAVRPDDAASSLWEGLPVSVRDAVRNLMRWAGTEEHA
ncbi:MAG: DNA-directed RNA polymerase subunit alpha C-terminal domain-containing protein, partial [Pirellulaceae bacterium]